MYILSQNFYVYFEGDKIIVSVFDEVKKTFTKTYFTDIREAITYISKITKTEEEANNFINEY